MRVLVVEDDPKIRREWTKAKAASLWITAPTESFSHVHVLSKAHCGCGPAGFSLSCYADAGFLVARPMLLSFSSAHASDAVVTLQ